MFFKGKLQNYRLHLGRKFNKFVYFISPLILLNYFYLFLLFISKGEFLWAIFYLLGNFGWIYIAYLASVSIQLENEAGERSKFYREQQRDLENLLNEYKKLVNR